MAYYFTLALCVAFASVVKAQPSPSLQKRISEAIANAANATNPDYTAFVNPFIGTGMSGDLFSCIHY